MDVVINQAYAVARGLYAFSLAFQEYSAQKFPYAPIIVLVAHCINGSMVVHSANKDKPTLYWLHSLVTTVLAGFGGGIITPVILGAKPSIIFANDLVIPMSCTIWYLTNYCGFDEVFSFKPVKLLWNVVVTLWRTNACINAVTLACNTIKPGLYYPSPIMGAIIGGTLINSLGAFVPFDKGLAPIQKGTAFPIQSAFLTACLFFFIIKDRDGFIGIFLRGIVGDLSQRVVVGIMSGFQVLTLGSQVVFDDPNANFLTPLFKVVYYVSRVQGPPVVPAPAVVPAKLLDSDATNTDSAKKNTTSTAPVTTTITKKGFTFARFTTLVHCTIGFCALCYYLSLRLPATSIPAVKASLHSVNTIPYVTLNTIQLSRLSGSAPIGVNQWLQMVPFAVPTQSAYALRLEQYSVCSTTTSAGDNTAVCEVPPECTAYSTRAACERSRGALVGLYEHKTTSTGYRLAVHSGPGRHVTLPTHVFTTGLDHTNPATSNIHTNTTWSALLPLTYTSAAALAEIDPHFTFEQVELYLTTNSEVYLVYNTQFAGSIFNVHKLSARVLWSGVADVTCANKLNGTVSTGSIEAVSLYLDPVSGAPRILCSDGDSVAFSIGTVVKDVETSSTENNTVESTVVNSVASNTVESVVEVAADAVSTKSEL
mmetsp:Transcript_27945/g.47831  ORF Transcript_27945/g.47831 Transcript_27945/m.47831 type:complete len:650 (-) Transcript_27945:210-2159(-)